MEKRTSIVICAYNEKETVEYVVRSCQKFNPDEEIVVVDDGSDDGTQDLLRSLEKELPIQYVELDKNYGKSYAMATGVEKARHDIILFFDADVSGIREVHFKKLLDPLREDPPEADMVVASPSDTLINYKVNPFRSLTGERSLLRKDLLPILDDIRNIRFGIETYLNLFYQSQGKKVKYTMLEGLAHPTRYKKTTPGQATREYLSEGQEIAETLLKNYDLIVKSIGSRFDASSETLKEKYRKLQEEINEKIQALLKNYG